jgi:hypothetical protein
MFIHNGTVVFILGSSQTDILRMGKTRQFALTLESRGISDMLVNISYGKTLT